MSDDIAAIARRFHIVRERLGVSTAELMTRFSQVVAATEGLTQAAAPQRLREGSVRQLLRSNLAASPDGMSSRELMLKIDHCSPATVQNTLSRYPEFRIDPISGRWKLVTEALAEAKE